MDNAIRAQWWQTGDLSATSIQGVVAVADDDPDILDALGSWLEMAQVPSSLHSSGESLAAALQRDGEQALIRIRPGSHLTRPLACVILDVNLPGIHGQAMATNLRRQFPQLALILVTALGPADVARLGKLPPGVLCLQKPINLSALEEAMVQRLY